MNATSSMVALLARMRRERNGAVADAMCRYGSPCSLNYGVSLPTVRQIARAETPDHAYARLLWQQDVRELRLAALHLADPSRLADESAFWAAGIVDAELAEEAAFALLSHAEALAGLFAEWCAAPEPLLRYAVLLAAARSPQTTAGWIAPACGALSLAAEPAAVRLVAQGAVAMFAALGAQGAEQRRAVLEAVGALTQGAAADYVREELAWRLA